MPYIHTVYYSERFFTFFEPLYNYITLSCIVTYSHTCINIGFYMWFLYIYLSMRSRYWIHARTTRRCVRKKIYKRKKGEIREAQKEGGDENTRWRKSVSFRRTAVIQDERALICT